MLLQVSDRFFPIKDSQKLHFCYFPCNVKMEHSHFDGLNPSKNITQQPVNFYISWIFFTVPELNLLVVSLLVGVSFRMLCIPTALDGMTLVETLNMVKENYVIVVSLNKDI